MNPSSITCNIAVLGAGMVGRAIALDLSKQYRVTSFDNNAANLEELQGMDSSIKVVPADLSQYDQYADWFSPFDIVVTAVPGFMGYQTLEAVIRSGKNAVDISFFPEEALQLDALAKERQVTVITDCGVAPGMSNLILGRYHACMKIDAFECYVGGLPKKPLPPFFYKAPFSPADVIQEYIRPARMVEGGRIVTKAALTDREILFFEPVGKLEAFNTDGLRSLLHTMPGIPEMKEKTLRWPGHLELIIGLQQAGFFDTQTMRIRDTAISPLELTSGILLKAWKYGPGETEFTIMKVIIRGEGKEIVYDLYDEYDPETKQSSMARTTGYTCTAAVNLLIRGLFNEKGIFPPELVGCRQECFDYVMEYLKERKVIWNLSEK